MDTSADRTVVSADGTSIVVREVRVGTPSIADLVKPPIVVIGSVFDRVGTPYITGLAERLAQRFRVFLYDRRDSTPRPQNVPWSVEREIGDLDAVVRSIDGEVSLLGLCTGGGLALRSIAAGLPVRGAVVYETPYRSASDPDEDDVLLAVRLDEMLAAGRRSSALRAFLVRVLGLPVGQVTAMRLRPAQWRKLLTMAAALPREVRVMTGLAIPEQVFAGIGVPVLVAAGTDSPDWMKLAVRAVVEAVPGSEHTVLRDQGHIADAEVLAAAVERFLLR